MSLIRWFALTLLLPAPLFAVAPPSRIDCERVTVLLKLLDDDEFEVRHAADQELRQLGKSVLPYLRDEQMRTMSPEVRDRLTRMVRDLTADETLPHLLRMLTHKDARYRNHAQHALTRMTPDHLPALEEALQRGVTPQSRAILEQVIAQLKR